jgi:hypothetical protein
MGRDIALRTAVEALTILDGIINIAKAERLVHGVYSSSNGGSVCNGPRACLIGSAGIAAGLKPREVDWYSVVLAKDWAAHPRKYTGLKLALQVLDEEALHRAKHPPYDNEDQEKDWGWGDEDEIGGLAEGYFESYLPSLHDNYVDDDADRKQVVLLCRAAKRRLAKATA